MDAEAAPNDDHLEVTDRRSSSVELRLPDGHRMTFDITGAWFPTDEFPDLGAGLLLGVRRALGELLDREPDAEVPGSIELEMWELSAVADMSALIAAATGGTPEDALHLAAFDALVLDLPATTMVLSCWATANEGRSPLELASELWGGLPEELRDLMEINELIDDHTSITLVSSPEPDRRFDTVPAFAIANGAGHVQVRFMLQARGPLAGAAGDILGRIALTARIDSSDDHTSTVQENPS